MKIFVITCILFTFGMPTPAHGRNPSKRRDKQVQTQKGKRHKTRQQEQKSLDEELEKDILDEEEGRGK